MSKFRAVFFVEKPISIHYLGDFPAGAVVTARLGIFGALVNAANQGYGRPGFMSEDELRARESAPYPGITGAKLVGSYVTAARNVKDFESMRRRFRLDAFNRLPAFEQAECRRLWGRGVDRPICLPGQQWPQSEDPHAVAIQARLDRYADQQIAIHKQRAERNREAELAAEREFYGLSEKRAARARAEAEAAARLASEAEELARQFAAANMKTTAELESAARDNRPKVAEPAVQELQARAAEEHRRNVRRIVDAALAGVEACRKVGKDPETGEPIRTTAATVPAQKLARANALANEAAAKFAADDLEGALAAAQQAAAALEARGVVAAGVLPS
jgi:hypothetical protein